MGLEGIKKLVGGIKNLAKAGFSQTKETAKEQNAKIANSLKDGKTNENELVEIANSPAETVENSGNFDEALTSEFHKTGFLKGYSMIEGSINDKTISIRQDVLKNSLFSKCAYSGTMGDDDVELNVDWKTNCYNNTTGHIGDKEINLKYKSGIFGKFSVTGTIGDKEINIKKGSPIDEAQGENDILATVLGVNGNKFVVKNGKFKSIAYTDYAAEIMAKMTSE